MQGLQYHYQLFVMICYRNYGYQHILLQGYFSVCFLWIRPEFYYALS